MVHSSMIPHSSNNPTPHPSQSKHLAHSQYRDASNLLIPRHLLTLSKTTRDMPPPWHAENSAWRAFFFFALGKPYRAQYDPSRDVHRLPINASHSIHKPRAIIE